MPYTPASLAAYMQTILDDTADALVWDVNSPVLAEAVTDAVLMYGVATLADATDMRRIRVAARVAAWRMVVQATAGAVDSTLDGQSLHRSQMQPQAKAALAMAEQEAAVLGINVGAAGGAVMGRVTLDWAEPANVNGWLW